MNEPPSTSDERDINILDFQAALYAQFEAEEKERTNLDLSGLEFFDAEKIPADPSAPCFLDVFEEVDETKTSNQQPQDDVRMEMTNYGLNDLSSQFVPKQAVKPIRNSDVVFPVECPYLKLSAGLDEKATNWLRLSAQPWKNDGDMVALMITLFGPDMADAKSATIPAILIKIAGLTQAILGGARVVATGNDTNIYHDAMRRPLGDRAPPNILLKPLGISDRAWGLILTAMLPSADVHTEHPEDRRFMGAFFRHDIPGLRDILTNGSGTPIGSACCGMNVAQEVETWMNKTFGHKLMRKIQNSVACLSTVYGPVPCPGQDASRYYKAEGTRNVRVNWADPIGDNIPEADALGALVNLPEATRPAGNLAEWNPNTDNFDRTREYRVDNLIGRAGSVDLTPYLLPIVQAAVPGAKIANYAFVQGQTASPYSGVAQVPGHVDVTWTDALGVIPGAPAAAQAVPNPLPINFNPVGAIPAFAANWSSLYLRVADYLTGYPRNTSVRVNQLANYVPPDATRDEGVRDVYGLIDAASVHHVPVMESRIVGAILSGFMRLTRTGERGKWGAKTYEERISDVNYRGRELHYLFNSVRYALQQDPGQSDDSLIDGRLLMERFKDPVSTYTGPFRLDRRVDPGPTIECLESPLIMRTGGIRKKAMRFEGGVFSYKASGLSTLIKVRQNNRKALDSAMRAYGMTNNGADIRFREPPATPAVMVQLNNVGAGDPLLAHIAPFSLPSRHRSHQDGAMVNSKLSCAGSARGYFMGDTDNIAERIM